jgi:hypothetical protein
MKAEDDSPQEAKMRRGFTAENAEDAEKDKEEN